MTYLKAFLLGLVQGVAEFLPISSSGHLAIARNLLNMEGAGDIPEFFDVLLHLGTLIAVFIAYWRDIKDMVVEFFRGIRDLAHRTTPTPVPPARRLILLIIIGTLPLFAVLPIRKAVQVLQDRAVVNVREQSGVYVLSAAQARQCLGSFKDGGGLIGKKHQLRQLLEQQQALGRELQELCSSILDEMILPAQAAQSLPNYCVRIPEDWDGAGKSLGALKFWRATGATVVAIRRSGQEIVSPGPDTALRCGDLLIFVGDLEARKGVVRFFSSNP